MFSGFTIVSHVEVMAYLMRSKSKSLHWLAKPRSAFFLHRGNITVCTNLCINGVFRFN